jgi:hypothetical protein
MKCTKFKIYLNKNLDFVEFTALFYKAAFGHIDLGYFGVLYFADTNNDHR